MSMVLKPDVCVIGAGSGGLSVAAGAAAFGLDVTLVERGKMGGDCLNYGCVPSKALIAAARTLHRDTQSLTGARPRFDYGPVRAQVGAAIASIAPHDSEERFSGLGVKVIREDGRFTDPGTLSAGDFEIRARRFVIATGSSPLIPGIPGLDVTPYLTNETIFDLADLPDHLVILGGGAIGCEIGQAMARLGARVTIVEATALLGREDRDAAGLLLAALEADGVKIHQQSAVTGVEQTVQGVQLSCRRGGETFVLQGSHLFVATGRRANVAGLGLAAAGVTFGGKAILTGRGQKTSNARIYAVGDVAGGPGLTHAAGYQAGLALAHILFRLPLLQKPHLIPHAIFTSPEIAAIGMQEADITDNAAFTVIRAEFDRNDRARIDQKPQGFLKIIIDRRKRIAGVTIAGENAAEMIAFWSLALSKGMKIGDIRNFIAPYPTYSEIGKLAATAYYAPLARKGWVRRIVGMMSKI
jgi:pyruvate/2-oxoglutarate dehydrogenase complex dihydrolipoamide dehydrogenase (E3) component